MSTVVPPIPASCAARPTIGGLVAPVINLPLADGGWDFRSRHQATVDRCWKEGRCQVCGQRITHRAVLFGGPNQVGSGRYDEPALCVPCAVYASQACPMVAGRQAHYAARLQLARGGRGATCPDPDCGCGGYQAGPGADHFGDPAHPWFAVFIRPLAYAVTVNEEQLYCSDGGCNRLHTRTVTNGCQLTESPVKVVLVSQPGQGRVWRRMEREEWPANTCPTTEQRSPR